MEPEGIAMIANPIKHRERMYLGGIEQYEGKLLTVFDGNEKGCFVITDDETAFGQIHEDDIVCIIAPAIKRQAVCMPAGMKYLEEAAWIARAKHHGIDDFNSKFVNACMACQEVVREINFL